MAYSELIKSFGRVRDFVRQFYVYGFHRRDEYTRTSARSYDNERRRIESWLGDYMGFRQNSEGKQVFLSVDSRAIPVNPLYQAFKAGSFTPGDVTFHFFVLDLLADGAARSVTEISDALAENYISAFPAAEPLEDSTLRKKLKEYVALGLLTQTRRGRETVYARAEDRVDLERWRDALEFFTEADPLGVVGSYLLDKLPSGESPFSFKHHYILHALDSEVLCALLTAIGEKRAVELEISVERRRGGIARKHTVCPVKIFISTQSGREYLLGWNEEFRRLLFFRLDTICSVRPGELAPDYDRYAALVKEKEPHLWGISCNPCCAAEHVEMDIAVGPGEDYIVDRLLRERRCGRVEQIGEGLWRFSADVQNALEMLPWIRTFIGRVAALRSSDPQLTRRFYGDLSAMEAIYGGDDDDLQ